MTAIKYPIPEDTTGIEEQAAEYALLSQFYLRNPDETLLKSVEHLSPEAFKGKEKQEAIKGILAFTEVEIIPLDQKVLDLKREWTKLFRGVSPIYGPPPPYAAQYLKENPGKVMTDIVQLYTDGGYEGYKNIKDRVDYIGVEFQYLSFIDLLRINAIKEKNEVEYGRLSLCHDVFFANYIKPWIKAFCEKADKFAKTSFYQGVLKLTQCVVASDQPISSSSKVS